MRLPPDQVERFFRIWRPLILYVNRKLRGEPAILDARPDEPWDTQNVYTIREALWANEAVREALVTENPAGLSAADLTIVESGRHPAERKETQQP
jgi:hypothetical protein